MDLIEQQTEQQVRLLKPNSSRLWSVFLKSADQTFFFSVNAWTRRGAIRIARQHLYERTVDDAMGPEIVLEAHATYHGGVPRVRDRVAKFWARISNRFYKHTGHKQDVQRDMDRQLLPLPKFDVSELNPEDFAEYCAKRYNVDIPSPPYVSWHG